MGEGGGLGRVLVIEFHDQESSVFDAVMEVLKHHADFKIIQPSDETVISVPGLEIYPERRKISWAEKFDLATHEQKKMIECQLLKRVEVGRGCKISVELNMTYRQFCTEWNAEDFLDTLSAI